MTPCLGGFRDRGIFEWGKDWKEECWVVSIRQVEDIDVRGVIRDDQITSSGFPIRYLRYVFVSANRISARFETDILTSKCRNVVRTSFWKRPSQL